MSKSYEVKELRRGLIPMHEVCRTIVEVPTVLVEPDRDPSNGRRNPDPKIFVQWYGEAEGVDLQNQQFKFPLISDIYEPRWMSQPELFKTIMIGQVKEWPKKEAVKAIADMAFEGNQEGWIIWLVSTHYRVRNPSGEGPPCFFLPWRVMLADPVVGVITPRKYLDLSVLDRANEAVIGISIVRVN